MTLGDLGADVIKVESPAGDDTRSWRPPADAQGRASYHHAANRNKRSVVLDLKDATDLELARELCRRADVVISNFKPGTLERFELDYERIAADNQGVVYCEISGFGEGAGRELPGYDPLVQAVGGLMSITGPPGHPSKAGFAIVDVVTALYAAVAVLAALYARRDTGRGQRVTIDLLHANLAMLANQSAGWLASGVAPVALGNTHPSIEPFATYRAADGELMLLAGNDAQFERLAVALDLPGLAADERFATNELRVRNRDGARRAARGAARDADAGGVARPRCRRQACRPGRCRRSTRRSRSLPPWASTSSTTPAACGPLRFPRTSPRHRRRRACRRPISTSTATRCELAQRRLTFTVAPARRNSAENGQPSSASSIAAAIASSSAPSTATWISTFEPTIWCP